MQVSPDTPFRVVVLGDFSGRQFRGVCEVGSKLANRPLLQIDRDKFDDVMSRLNVHLRQVAISSSKSPADLYFKSLDDFHPDQLFEQWEMFAALRSLRNKLFDDATYPEAAEQILSWGVAAAGADSSHASGSEPLRASVGPVSRYALGANMDLTPPASQQTAREQPTAVDAASLFENILDESNRIEQGRGAAMSWDQAIYNIVAPYTTENTKPKQSELLKCVDAATQSLMTALLHHRSFSALESAWRSLKFLISRVESSPQLKVYLVDVSLQELVTDLSSTEDLESSAFYRLIADQIPHLFDDEPVSLLIGDYQFGCGSIISGIEDRDTGEIEILKKIARIAAAAETPFIAGLNNNAVLECPKSEDEGAEAVLSSAPFGDCPAWKELRSMSEAAYLGLVWPHFLVRTPYGQASRPIDAFAYEEITEAETHPTLLWGNSAFLCAVLLCESFSRFGWHMRGEEAKIIESLPTWVHELEGETVVCAGGEFPLTQRERSGLLAAGLTVVATVRDEDVVRISQLQSLYQPNLKGLWLT